MGVSINAAAICLAPKRDAWWAFALEQLREKSDGHMWNMNKCRQSVMGSTQFVVVNRQLALECFLSFSSIVRNGRHGQFSTSFIVLHGRRGQFLTSFIVFHGRHGQFLTSFIILHGRHGQFLNPFIVLHGRHGQSLNYFGRISSLFASFQVRKPRSR